MQARFLAVFPAFLFGCLALSACARSPEQTPMTSLPKENAMTEQPSTSQTGADAAPTDEGPLVDAQVGPHRFRIPAHYFDNQMGPEFDGSFGLFLEWPRLGPFPAGARSKLSLDVSLRSLSISVDYVDRVDINTLLDRRIAPMEHEADSPTANIALRIEGEPIYGLSPYYADFSKIFPYYKAIHGKDNIPVMKKDFHDDWYLARQHEDRLETVIKCTSREVVGDGVETTQGKWHRDDTSSLPECTHSFIIPDKKLSVTIRYLRLSLQDWKRIEDRTRQLIAGFYAGESTNTSTDGTR